MGMDVLGKSASSETGKYFRNNCWWWRPLANYACHVAPDITAKCQYWHSNDGDGLSAKQSKALADRLQAEIDSGRCAEYAMRYQSKADSTPDETCDICHGTGRRSDWESFGPEWLAATNGCNACHGKGTRRPSSTWYYFSIENVQEFVDFLRECGGFQIY